jgi:hypothetical protein
MLLPRSFCRDRHHSRIALIETCNHQPRAADVDPAKDQLLVNAFADAIKQAAQSMGGGA